MTIAYSSAQDCVADRKMNTNIINSMIWLCSNCITWNAHIVERCTVCNTQTTEHRTDDIDIMEIHFVTILWYMKAEIENRLHNIRVMEINVVKPNDNRQRIQWI